MNRQEKELLIQSLRTDFAENQAAFLVQVQGLTVSQLQELRKSLREQGGKLKLAKNTLTKIAANEVPELCDLKPYLKQQLALVFARNEPPAVAKVLWQASQDNDQLKLIAGCFESSVLDKEMIKFLATLPARPVLVAQLCGGIKAPLTRSVGVMHQVLARFLWVMQQASEKKQ